MPELLLQGCVVAAVLLISFALAWLSRRPPAPRTRRSPGTKLFLSTLALLSLLFPLAATLFFLLPGGSPVPALVLLVGVLAIAIYLLRSGMRVLLRSIHTLRQVVRNLYGHPARRDTTQTLAHTLARRMFKRDVLRTLHRHAWATVALLLTAASIDLTHRISSVHAENNGASLQIAFDSPQSLPRPAIIYLSASSGKPLSATIDLQLRRGQSVRLAFNALSASGCDNMTLSSMNDVHIDYHIDGVPSARLVTVQADPPTRVTQSDKPIPVSLNCTLDVTPIAETFAERTFEVDSINDSYFPPKDRATPTAAGHVVDFSIEGASDLTLLDDSTSPVPLTDTQRWLPNQDGRIFVKWHDTQSSEQRDVLLVLIGGLLGLAASCLLEWIRPYIAPE